MANEKVKVEDRSGELVVDKQRVTLKHKTDSMTLVNKTRSSVFWNVPAGPFEGTPFCIEVEANGESDAKLAAEHKATTEYTYQVLRSCPEEKKQPEQQRQGGGGRPADPIIIIDIDR
jgi:hypothetical protein